MGSTSTLMLTKLYKLKDGSRQGLNSLAPEHISKLGK